MISTVVIALATSADSGRADAFTGVTCAAIVTKMPSTTNVDRTVRTIRGWAKASIIGRVSRFG